MADKETQTRAEAIKSLEDKIKDIRFAMLTTVGDEGQLRSRPMTTLEVEFDGDLWFFVGLDTEPVRDLKNSSKVNVAYSKPNDNLYVSVSGHAEVVQDSAKKKELWNPLFKGWFPDGVEDPNLGLIRVEVDSAEYWDSPSSPVVLLVGFTKALLTGKPYGRGEDSENKEIDLSQS